MSAPIKVLVVDDSASTRGMLREALSMDGSIDVVGEAASGPEAVTGSAELTPDVVLMDVRMPGGSGVDAAREIMSQDPATKIVALTWSDDPESVRDMLAAGAIGYVVKGGSIDELVEAIRHASAGEAELDHRVLPAAVEDLRRLLEQETERREQVERLARAREEFVQVLSHELRTPLTVISGALRMLRGSREEDDAAPLVESALKRTEELEFLVEGLELIASGPRDEAPASAERAVASASERLGQAPDLAFIDDQVWTGVPHRYVVRVAFELLSNAFRHGKPPFGVTTYRRGGEAFLSVSDGGGWSPSSPDFTAFVQEDMSNTRPQSGFGLGLFMASRLCQACDGALTIREQAGTTIAEARFRMR